MKSRPEEIKRSIQVHSIAIVVARWNSEITEGLLNGALRYFEEIFSNLDSINVFRVPGAFEIPIACKTAAETGKYRAILGLGCVIKGDTPHFDYVCAETTRGIGAVSLESNVPTSFGLLTVDNIDQALERSADSSQNKGREAAQTAIEMISVLGEMRAINNEKC